MSTAEESLSLSTAAESLPTESTTVNMIDRLIGRVGDWLNPILVKETRQALKSRQFTISFWLVLLFAAGWSFVGISLQLPHVYYLPSGANMLTGYYIILSIPLLLVVPFSAYRSLATEREDGTYELLSITSLSARQIVTGKLGSALMQILVYYAALAPCIGFTYLLRGLDLGTIFVVLAGTFLVSVLLSTIGLVFAGAGSSRQWQSLTSVVLLLVLLAAGWAWCAMMLSLVFEGGSFIYTSEFLIAVGFILTMYVTFLAMFIFLAAAQNSFVTDNRSTKLRIMMLLQQLCFAAWMTFLWVKFADDDFAFPIIIVSAIAWTIYGSLMTGEVAELSPRARRDLPHSFFGRMFLSWFNPGASSGYIFTCATVLGTVSMVFAVNYIAADAKPDMAADVMDLGCFCVLVWSYVTIYLGLGRLLILLLRKVSGFGLAAAMMIHTLLITTGCIVPYFFGYWVNEFRSIEYSELQMSNWIWTLEQAGRGKGMSWLVMFPVCGFGLVVLAVNLILAGREVEATRMDAPDRVQLDEATSSHQAST